MKKILTITAVTVIMLFTVSCMDNAFSIQINRPSGEKTTDTYGVTDTTHENYILTPGKDTGISIVVGDTTKAPETINLPETTKAPETTASQETTNTPDTTNSPETVMPPDTTKAPDTTGGPETTASFDTTSETPGVCAHEYTEKTIAPTCTDEGYTEYKCTKCGYSYVGNRVAPNGHTLATIFASEPTCFADGKTEGLYCSVCGEVIKTPENVPALGHRYGDDGKCIYCGKAEDEGTTAPETTKEPETTKWGELELPEIPLN